MHSDVVCADEREDMRKRIETLEAQLEYAIENLKLLEVGESHTSDIKHIIAHLEKEGRK